MSDLFAKGAAMLARHRAQSLSAMVTYQRRGAGGISVSVPATVGKTLYRTEDANGNYTETEVRDYLILANDLSLGSIQIEPAPGDRIVEGDLATGATYQVSPPPTRDPVWGWSDHYQLARRIHTKFIGNQPVP